MPKHTTKVGRWTVEDGGAVAGATRTMKDGTEILSSKQIEVLELRAAITVLTDVELVTGAEIKFARKSMGLRQADLAEHLGVNSETVSRWETDADSFKRPVQLAVLRLLEEFQRTGSIARPIRSPRASDRVLVASAR
jgi:DNA-binding transcriptional regulator YiaG